MSPMPDSRGLYRLAQGCSTGGGQGEGCKVGEPGRCRVCSRANAHGPVEKPHDKG